MILFIRVFAILGVVLGMSLLVVPAGATETEVPQVDYLQESGALTANIAPACLGVSDGGSCNYTRTVAGECCGGRCLKRIECRECGRNLPNGTGCTTATGLGGSCSNGACKAGP